MDTEPENGVDRRTVIAAGAWSVPVIVLTTATPAVAASATTFLKWTGPWTYHAGDGFLYIGGNLQLQGPAGGLPNSVSGVTITLVVPKTAASGEPSQVALGDTVWTALNGGVPGSSADGLSWVFTFLYSGVITLFGSASQNLVARIPENAGVSPGYTASVVGSATGVSSIDASFPVSDAPVPELLGHLWPVP